jgi:tetrapyrrole methylase family protein/MazG family protein
MMAHLRSPKGCPWDREQTHDTLRPYLLEECYEVLDAIAEGSQEKLCVELGDLLLQVLFHAQLAAEEGSFRIDDVLRALRDKLRGRHVHVWGDAELSTPDEVLKSWEAIKRRERGNADDSVLADIPVAQPALMRAQAITRKAARVGFDWPNLTGPMNKVVEETEELRELIAQPHAVPERLAEELGDLLIAVVNVARHLQTDAEQALTLAVERWVQRFQYVERQARASGRQPEQMTLAELDQLWEEAKRGRQ